MKKHRIKNYLRLGILLFGISLFMTNCNNDDESVMDESQLEQTTPLILSQRIPFDEAMHFNKLETKINEIKDKLNNFSIQNRAEENEDIVILIDEVSYTTYAGTYTYTFKILRAQPQAFIENIVLHYNIETDSYDEYLMQYHLKADEFMSLHQGDFLQNSDNVTITTLEQGFFNSQTLGRDCGIICETIHGSCSSGQHHSGNISSWGGCTASTGPSIFQSCYSTCNEISAGDSSTGGGGISASGGGSTTVVSNPIPTEPCDTNSTGGIGITGSNGDCLAVEDDRETTCEKIASQISNPFFNAKIEILKSKTSHKKETGFSQNSDGSFNSLSPSLANNGHSLAIPITTNMVGYMHTHLDDFLNGKFDKDGNPGETRPIRMFSPGDVKRFLELLLNANANNIPITDVYGTMVSSSGIYTLRFTGNIADVNANFSTNALNVKYLEKFEEYSNNERAFLHFIKDEIGIEGISLYKIKANGTIKKKFLKDNGKLDSETCE